MYSPAERLRSVRIATGYKTAQDAARAMGMKIPTYHGHENGTTGLRRTAAIRYAKFYNISLDWLLMGVGDGRQKLRAATVDSAETEAMLGAADTPETHPAETATDPAFNRLAAYRPYPKQKLFHEGGAIHNERLFMAANQVGKTLAGASEWAMHLTGHYPDWWLGRRFAGPVRMWAAGVTAQSTRDNPQRVLVGPPQQKELWGTGTIPKACLKEWTSARGVADGLDSVVVRWSGGGDTGAQYSVLSFKSYEQGREKWQGETLHGVWFDEEPPLDIYSEGKTRTNALNGIVIVTFTPLLGMSDVVKLFLTEADVANMRRLAKGEPLNPHVP